MHPDLKTKSGPPPLCTFMTISKRMYYVCPYVLWYKMKATTTFFGLLWYFILSFRKRLVSVLRSSAGRHIMPPLQWLSLLRIFQLLPWWGEGVSLRLLSSSQSKSVISSVKSLLLLYWDDNNRQVWELKKPINIRSAIIVWPLKPLPPQAIIEKGKTEIFFANDPLVFR